MHLQLKPRALIFKQINLSTLYLAVLLFEVDHRIAGVNVTCNDPVLSLIIPERTAVATMFISTG